MSNRHWRAVACVVAGLLPAAAGAETVRIGLMNDQSSLYADAAGPGSVEAAKLAIIDFQSKHPGWTVDLKIADHQNRPDIGTSIVRKWLEIDKVDAVLDVPNSGVALAVSELMRGSRAAFLASSPATSDLTGTACSPNTMQWTYDSWSLSNAIGTEIVKRGGKRWFLVAADYAFGLAFEKDLGVAIKQASGDVIGTVRHPINTSDFASYLLQAASADPDVIAVANAGGDTTTSIKQSVEFGLPKPRQTMVAMLLTINDVHGLGLASAKNFVLSEAFYWDTNDATRSWSRRFAAKNKGRMPTMNHAGVYSQLLAYLEAVERIRSTEVSRVYAEMRRGPIENTLFGTVTIRTDGRATHDMYVFQVKSPEESVGPYDYYKQIARVPAARAFRPQGEGGCPIQ
ncbi:ABC transporter substrate-binding protein [Tardiphaga sp.]|jgi:branched-chain amino acid transport system substrate-binding protein|uniref:ABC transporter substrate-binding protein n=1 Tax=Tardiphaga sp. TaxID=1926292 RepID=UPI0037D9F7E2